MAEMPVLVDLNPKSLESLPCCGVTRPDHEGRCQKNRWLAAQFKKGLRAKVLLTPEGRHCGYIEYLPGEYAWRGVDAKGYTFIHCLWTYGRRFHHQGLGGMMIQACLDDAAKAGAHGVAVVARDAPWLAGPDVYLDNGFEVVDTAPPDYQLLVKKLDAGAPSPAFQTGWEERQKKYAHGLTIIRSRQCPHIAKFADEIEETARREYGMEPRVVEIRSCREAQNAPTPYAVFAILHNGKLLTDHQVSRTRFRNIMNKLMKPPRPRRRAPAQ